MQLQKRIVFFAGIVGLLARTSLVTGADSPPLASLQQAYTPIIRPLIQRYCQDCHSGDEAEAEIDLNAFTNIAEIRKGIKTWQKIDEMLDTLQMPPKEADQPTEDERLLLRNWVRDYLTAEAVSQAGDPGAVVLRRLSNSEYTYTLRDLTGIALLNPAEEFPIDGAAGEGFTNTGGALVMSPSLVTKYLDAAKRIADHMVLLPKGIRFSPLMTRRDHTDELLAQIRDFYAQFSDAAGSTSVNLQGIKFDINQGGRLPLEKYLMATLAEREAISQQQKSVRQVAQERGLNVRYFDFLWRALSADAGLTTSLLLDEVRASWRAADANQVDTVLMEIGRWQKSLWKFNSIGHIGREGGPAAWMEPITLTTVQQQFSLDLPADHETGGDIVLYLAAGDAGDGNFSDHVLWKNARLEAEGRPTVMLRDVDGLRNQMEQIRREQFSKTALYLKLASDIGPTTNLPELAAQHDVDEAMLEKLLEYLAVETSDPFVVTGHFTDKDSNVAGYDFVSSWGTSATPLLGANSSDQQVRIPGVAKPHAMFAHPSVTHFSAVGWHSPINGAIRVEAYLADADVGGGNGVEWVVQRRTAIKTDKLWQGEFDSGQSAKMPPQTITVYQGDLVSFLVGPRQQNHVCDLTEIRLKITETDGEKRIWDLTADVSDDILESNPHADSHGNKQTWHFYKGEMTSISKDQQQSTKIPTGSLLAQWKEEQDSAKRNALAQHVQELVMSDRPGDNGAPDAVLYDLLQSLPVTVDIDKLLENVVPDERFGKHPQNAPVSSADLVVEAPSITEVRVPAELAAGRRLVVVGQLDSKHGAEGSVQLQVGFAKPNIDGTSSELPFVVTYASNARRRLEASFDEFRELFPVALCYAKIVPVDEVVTLTLFYREDEPLCRLMLDVEQAEQLNRFWDELEFVSQEPFGLVNAFEQISEFATQDRPDLVIALKPMHKRILQRAEDFKQRLVDSELSHLTAVLEFTDRAWRRSLTEVERQGLHEFYRQLRAEGVSHEEAIRLMLVRVLTSPAFLYRAEQPAPGKMSQPVSDLELASRLSYFLWASTPDDELRYLAENEQLGDYATVVAQAHRMLDDDRTRRLAIQFACQWLHIRDFDQNVEKNERLYPEFARLRGEMYEESVRFFADMFRNDGSILGLLNANHTFLNQTLAEHYSIDGVTGPDWRRVTGMRKIGRGGVLGMATVLASQSGASRTSPILRGNWVYETLLGERLPRPPANVPQLPDTVPSGLTERELIEQHSSVPECAKCHARIDPYGFALEQYDVMGRIRSRQVDTKTELPDGQVMEGMQGLRDYLMTDRRNDIVRQFCRKLLGYSLGREVQLSDRPLMDQMQSRLEENGYRFSVAIEAIVSSPQFREIRGISFEP